MTTRHHLLQKLPVDLKRLSLTEWDELFQHLEISPLTQQQVFESVFYHNITETDKLPHFANKEAAALSGITTILNSEREELLRSNDGSYKLTLRLHDGHQVEVVIIPEWTNGELQKCSASISSQVGCFFGCSFCATGRMGFHRNLTTGELLDQVREAENVVREELNTELTHLYFMGMGEPMHNYRAVSDALTIMRNDAAPGPPPSHITVSTVGLYRQIRMLASDHPEVKLAVSIHSADQQTRFRIMPVSARLGLSEIREALEFHHRITGNPATIQYLLLSDVNDRPEDADKLVAYLDKLPVKITLILYNTVSESVNSRTEIPKVIMFKKTLEDSGLPTDIRWCHGEDIEAGCGQLKIPGRDEDERVSMSMRHQSNKTPAG